MLAVIVAVLAFKVTLMILTVIAQVIEIITTDDGKQTDATAAETAKIALAYRRHKRHPLATDTAEHAEIQ